MVAEAAPTPDELARALEAFLAEHPASILSEDGKALFAMDRARYSIKAEGTRCVLQVWNEERNIVRRIVGCRLRKGTLFLSASRFGQSKPVPLELSIETTRRVLGERQAARQRYITTLERVLRDAYPDWKLENMRTEADLTRSFSANYVRAEMRRGPTVMALVAVPEDESVETADDALTAGILWLDYLRSRASGDKLVSGLRMIVPTGRAVLNASRIAWLNQDLARWELLTLDSFTSELLPVAANYSGNMETRLLPAPDVARTRERFAQEISTVLEAVPEAHVDIVSSGEVAFRLHGLAFARARLRTDNGTFGRHAEITFGAGANETTLDDDTAPLFQTLLARLRTGRAPEADTHHALYRMQPEAWLVSRIQQSPEVLDEPLSGSQVYAQVAAFEAADRGMLDLLALTRDGRLAVVEVKAQEDMQLPLQGLDYWVRVRHHHLRATPSEFARRGYFPGREIAAVEPLLILAAPALRVHPSNEIVLRYISPRVPWLLVGLDERWRTVLRAAWRKRSST